jgi:hypothetical protein
VTAPPPDQVSRLHVPWQLVALQQVTPVPKHPGSGNGVSS